MRSFLKYFIRGALVSVPIAATIYVVYLVFTKIDTLFPIGIPGVGFFATILIITIVGLLTSNVIGRKIVKLTEKLFAQLPLLKMLYGSIKDLVGAFVGEKKSFDQPVLVSILPGGGKLLGFLTQKQVDMPGLEDYVAVYFPQSYNFAGNLALFPRSVVEPIDVDSSDFMAFVVSGGISSTDKEEIVEEKP